MQTSRQLAETLSRQAARRDEAGPKRGASDTQYRSACAAGHLAAARAWVGVDLRLALLETASAHNFLDPACDAPTQMAGELVARL